MPLFGKYNWHGARFSRGTVALVLSIKNVGRRKKTKAGRDGIMKGMTSGRSHGILTVSLMLGLFVTLAGCGRTKSEFYSDPNVYLVKQLATKRIIMLGDFYHSAPLPYQTLTSLLNEWVNEVAAGKSHDRKVVLVLEADKQIVDNLKSFVSTGDLKPLVDYWLPNNTMEWLEFCSNLRALHQKIDSLNVRRRNGEKILFDIFGGEAFNVIDNPSLLRWSREEGTKDFVGVRDSLAGQNIIGHLDSCGDTKAIIFYGLPHLIGNYVHKNVKGELPRSETGGYYLAHYLKKRFGADSVSTVCQIPPYLLGKESGFFRVAVDSDIYFPSSEVNAEDIHLPGLQPRDFDGFITRHELDIPGHPLTDVFSKRVIQADISRMLFFKRFLPGAMAKSYYDEALESLQLITGRDFKDPAEWEHFAERVQYDGFARIESIAFADSMFHKFYSNTGSVSTRERLYEMGLRLPILGMEWTPSERYWRETLWPNAVDDIKLNTSVGLLWVGTPQEKKEAAEYLVKALGNPLEQPQVYLKLLRHRFYNVDY